MRSVRSVLRSIIARGHYSEKDAANLMKDAFGALLYLHDLGIVHRDLKPENLLYASNDEKSPMYDVIKLADFGLAKVVQGGNDHSMTTTCGTPGYVAPEVLANKSYNQQCDSWSLGVLSFFTLTGQVPFQGKNMNNLFDNIQNNSAPTSPLLESQACSDAAIDFVSKLLIKSPEDRMTVEDALRHDWMSESIPATSTTA